MCGIAGIVALKPVRVQPERLLRMASALRHRGPDGEGIWMNEEHTIGFAHRRLSILDLDAAASQPMHFLDRYVIVYNGEIYNYIELKEKLKIAGYQFQTKSDTEVLLALYHHFGNKCLDELDGMFAFVIFDRLTQMIFGARDRFGEKPFFYGVFNDFFFFASEMKALWSAGIPRIPDHRMLFLYLAYGTQRDDSCPHRTFFEGISQLQPGCYLEINQFKSITIKRFWDIDKHKRIDLSLEDASRTFYDLLTSSVFRRLRSDVPIGSSLSGGLDSSSIVLLIDRLKNSDMIQKTFSARFGDFERDEGVHIEKVIDAVSAESHAVRLTADELSAKIEEVFFYQEEPFGSTSVIAQWEVMRLAKDNAVTVLLDGQGADEVLGGYLHLFGPYLGSVLRSSPLEYFKQMKYFMAIHGAPFPASPGWFMDVFFPHLRNHLRTFRNRLYIPPYLKQFTVKFMNSLEDVSFTNCFAHDLNTALLGMMLNGGLQNLLRYADRNSMAHSREVRLPFLNFKLVEFVFSLPDEYKLHNGWTKYLLRMAMEETLPSQICWRKDKIGFEPPQSRDVPPALLSKSIEKLYDHEIIEPGKTLPSLNWEYVQAGLLFA